MKPNHMKPIRISKKVNALLKYISVVNGLTKYNGLKLCLNVYKDKYKGNYDSAPIQNSLIYRQICRPLYTVVNANSSTLQLLKEIHNNTNESYLSGLIGTMDRVVISLQNDMENVPKDIRVNWLDEEYTNWAKELPTYKEGV